MRELDWRLAVMIIREKLIPRYMLAATKLLCQQLVLLSSSHLTHAPANTLSPNLRKAQAKKISHHLQLITLGDEGTSWMGRTHKRCAPSVYLDCSPSLIFFFLSFIADSARRYLSNPGFTSSLWLWLEELNRNEGWSSSVWIVGEEQRADDQGDDGGGDRDGILGPLYSAT